MTSPFHRLGCTGHRPDKCGGYSREVRHELVKCAKTHLRALQPSVVYTGMAMGWDQAIAEACAKENIPYECCIPFEGQERNWSMWYRKHYHSLLEHARAVRYVNRGGYAAWKMQRRNEWICDNSTYILALFNGSEGGTANCLKYAKSIGLEYANAWDDYARNLDWDGIAKRKQEWIDKKNAQHKDDDIPF